MQTYSEGYKALQEQFHRERSDYGISGHKYAPHVLQLSEKMGTKDILDYGCGRCTLQKSLPFPIQNYDPFIPEHSKRPHPAQIVCCTDVMEHIEPSYLDEVLCDIRDLTLSLAFFQIATRPASKFLPDGRNAHLIQQPINWWLLKMIPYFDFKALQEIGGGFVAVCSPIPKAQE